jgi:tRNA A-37 threonylcarbamoyl transferase component Bud32
MGKLDNVKALVTAKADVNLPDQYGYTPLTRVAPRGYEAVIQVLMEAKADVNLLNKDGSTPLTRAASNGYEAVARVLIEAKADVNLPDKNGPTPLTWAACKGHGAVTLALIEAKADVNLPDKNGYTPLWRAASKNFESDQEAQDRPKLAILKMLLASGAVITKNKSGQTPSQAAEEAGYHEVAAYLRPLEATAFAEQSAPTPTVKKDDPAVSDNKEKPAEKIASVSTPVVSPTKPAPEEITINFSIRQSDLVLEEEPLDEGSYGEVYKGEWRHNTVAVKKFFRFKLNDKLVHDIKKEAKVMGQVSTRSDYLVKLMGLCLEKPVCLVMEYLPNGNLNQYLHNSQPISWEIRYRLARDIAVGLTHLHEAEVLHRDLKSFNILLDSQYRAKVADFGFASIKTEVSSSSKSGIKGTSEWIAPELLDRKRQDRSPTKAADIYSLGMVLWEIATRQKPYGKQPSLIILGLVMSGERAWKAIPDDCPQAFAALIKACCDEDPAKRPTANAVAGQLHTLWQENKSAPKVSAKTELADPVFSPSFDDYLTGPQSQDDMLQPVSASIFSQSSAHR